MRGTAVKKLWQTKRREILAGAAILLLLFILFYAVPERRTPMPEPEIGTLRMAEVLSAHPSYARLAALRAEERTLTLLLRDLPELPEITPPVTDPQPFEDSVWQKNAQTVISARVALEREQKSLTESVRAATEADYEARRKAIDDDYLNAILNINLKIDNQRAMHGPKVSEEELARERANWEAERDMLKHERAARQMELYRQWQEEIRARVAAQINPREAEWTRQMQETLEAQKGEAQRLQHEAEERSVKETERALAAQEGRTVQMQRAVRLASVRAEADALADEILRDVRSRAAKLAIQYHLSLVLASPEAEGSRLLQRSELFVTSRYVPILGDGVRDMTAQMVREMQQITPAAHQ